MSSSASEHRGSASSATVAVEAGSGRFILRRNVSQRRRSESQPRYCPPENPEACPVTTLVLQQLSLTLYLYSQLTFRKFVGTIPRSCLPDKLPTQKIRNIAFPDPQQPFRGLVHSVYLHPLTPPYLRTCLLDQIGPIRPHQRNHKTRRRIDPIPQSA